MRPVECVECAVPQHLWEFRLFTRMFWLVGVHTPCVHTTTRAMQLRREYYNLTSIGALRSGCVPQLLDQKTIGIPTIPKRFYELIWRWLPYLVQLVYVGRRP